MNDHPRAQKRRNAVLNACDEMVNEGQTPTVRAIIDRIGGSATTATNYLREWKQRDGLEDSEGRRLIKEAYQQLWADVQYRVEEAEKRTQAAEVEAEKARAEAREAQHRCEQAMIAEEAARQEVASTEEIRSTAELGLNIAKAQQKEAEQARVRAERAEENAKQLSTALIESTERIGRLFNQVERALQHFDACVQESRQSEDSDIKSWQEAVSRRLSDLESTQGQQGKEIIQQLEIITGAVEQIMERVEQLDQNKCSTPERTKKS